MTEAEIAAEKKAILKEMLDLLRTIPPGLCAPELQAKILTWDDPPTALQVLEVTDRAINGSLASHHVVMLLQALYEDLLLAEGVRHEDLVLKAHWRNAALA